jgi:hypothetical protein
MAAGDERSLPRDGVAGSGVAAVEHAGLAALTSGVRGNALKAATALRAHWAVLQEISERATVLPVRFGTVVENEAVLREQLLEPNAERLRAALEQLAGCVQMTVKGSYDEDALLRQVVSGSRPIASLRERVKRLPGAGAYYERIRLGQLVSEEVARWREADTRVALDTLAPHALDAHVEQESGASAAFSLSFLVRRDNEPEFGRHVGRLAREMSDRLEIRYAGPMPPYSFADVDLESGVGAWA